MKKYLLTFVALVCSLMVSAYGFEKDHIYYTITSETDLTVKVTSGVEYKGVVNIPSTVVFGGQTYNVTSIGESAFRDCSSLTSVTIPAGVTSIGEGAFRYCSSLKSVTLPAGLTSIGDGAFYDCSSLTSVAIPESVTSIEHFAFYGCSSLTSVTIPEGVTSIGQSTFLRCSSLTSITIPESVTSIGHGAFVGCSSLKSVTLPAGVTSIGEYAFSGCSSLTSVTIPEGLTSIGDAAFYQCDKLTTVIVGDATPAALVSGDVFSNRSNAVLYVPAGSKAAYESASVWREFKEIVEIENITFADGKVEEICVANWDTNGDGELGYIEAAAVTTIGQTFKANAEITSFDELQYFTALEKVSGDAFYNCVSLTSIILPSNVKTIEQNAFYSSGIISLEIPASVSSIADAAFNGIINMESITVAEGNPVFDSRNGCNAIIEIATGRLVAGCKNTVIPYGVTAIGSSAFRSNTNLTSITIPGSVTSIAADAFKGCKNLTKVTVGSATPLQLVDVNTFPSRGNATLYVPAGSKAAYESASVWSEFWEIVEFENISFADSKVKEICVANWDTNGDGELSYIEAAAVTTIGKAFKGKEITSFDELQYFTSVETLVENAFTDCVSLTSIILPSKVKTIEQNAFYSSGIISLEIPASVSSIADAAFNGIINMESITVAEGNPVFDSRNGCNAIIEIATGRLVAGCKNTVIPYGVTAIGSSAFRSNTNLTSITIPGSVTSIAADAFKGCKNLTKVTVGSATPLQLVDVNTFPSRGNATLYVPAGSKAAYESASVWSEFKEIVENENIIFADSKVKEICVDNWDTNGDGELSYIEADAVTSIGQTFRDKGITSFVELQYFTSVKTLTDNAFMYCSSLTSVTLPAGVTSIGKYAFSGCSSLTSVTLPAGVTSIGVAAFERCSSLTSITLPAGLTSIGGGAFQGCSSLTSLTLPAGVTSIGGSAFSGCSSLTNVTLPAGVTSIGGFAFSGCSSLTSITIPNSVTSIGNWAFNGCSSLTSITIPNSVTSIGGSAFRYCFSLTSITLPVGLTSIGEDAFCRCSSLTSVTIPESVTSIGGGAFSYCSSLTSLTLPVGVKSIGEEAFAECSSLTSLTLPAGLTSIGDYAFWGCNKLTTVIVGDATPAALVSGGVFSNRSNAVLYVPAGSKAAYESASVWSEFKEIVEEMEVPENMFVLNNMTLRAGQSGLFPVALTNESEFTAFQCDIYLPEGITLQTNKGKYDITLDEERMNDQTITTTLQADGAIRMAVDSFTSSLFSGNSGNLFYLNLLGGENISGDLTISIKNIHISAVDGTMYDLEDVTATITVPSYTPADVNDDGVIAINDVVLTINAVLGTYADNFVFAAADMNGDNQIMINDVVQVINSVLGLNTTSVLTARHIVRETLDINETQNGFGMSLSNAGGYVAMQYDMTLPAGVSINDIRVASGSNHSVSFREVGDGQVRVAVVSLTNEAFASGSLLEVSVSAESATSISITNAYVATRRGVMVEVADAEVQLTRGGATGIQAVGVEVAPADIFDLSGRIVKKAATSLEGLDKGVYLMNGKKVVVK